MGFNATCSWIYNYLCNQGLSPIEVYSLQLYVIEFVSDMSLVLGTPVYSINTTDRHEALYGCLG
jgi:hypothetical protein